MASIMDTERQFHIKTLPEEVGRYVILAGDPGRIPVIAGYLEDAKLVAENREYTVYTGTLDGEKVTVCSTGIGGPSSAIAVEELVKCGADTFIRVGTSGGIDLSVYGGDLVIATAAVRGEGTSFEYLLPEYPAAADFNVVSALVRSAQSLCDGTKGKSFHTGVVQSKDSFYGEVEPESSAVGGRLSEKWESYLKCGCLTSEMECAAIFSVATVRRVRSGAVLAAIWNAERSKRDLEDFIDLDVTKAIRCAVGAMKLLIEEDREALR
ncbi:MAG: nucleoside phosphorylase [Ruminococcus sp.]|nr:nucleoside phosphorylase [Ruminococcus sp.]